MSAPTDHAIGGYFGLELPSGPGGMPQRTGVRVQSARAALRLVLEHLRPPAVWVPRYICNDMLAPLRDLGIEARLYGIGPDLAPAAPLPALRRGELMLCVDYFGLAARALDPLLARIAPEQLIVDNAQAFYAPARPATITIWSPRKFFGVPDGGIVMAPFDLPEPREADRGSSARARHLLDRAQGDIERGYRRFRLAERSLEDTAPRRMSLLTQRLLDGIDFERVRRARRANFAWLQEHLGELNRFSFDPLPDAVPLCYPLWLRQPLSRERLAGQGIFVPRYWPGVEQRAAAGSVERDLFENCLPLPCDQRYAATDLQRLVRVIKTEVSATVS